MRLIYTFAILLNLCAFTLTTSCSSKAPVHPGAVNAVDSQLYDSLITLQAGIEAAKESEKTIPALKTPLNKIISDYDVAWKAYAAYHVALVNGTTVDPTTPQKLSLEVSAILSSLQSVINSTKTSK